MTSVLALDEGTSSARALLVGDDGTVRSSEQREIALQTRQPGWVEQDPEEIWSAQIACARAATRQSDASDVAAIGITNQRETTVVWERSTGRPIAPAIVWQDRRTLAQCEALRERGISERVQDVTGLVIDPYFSATKIAWILAHVPGARARANARELCFGTIDTWLIWKLTSGRLHVTDASNASRTMLFDLRTGDWSDEMLALFDIPRAMLPEIRSSSEILCEPEPALGLPRVPIAGIAGDQQAALFGQGCTRAGLAKNTYGTGCFLLVNTGDEPVISRHRLLSTVAWKIGKRTTFALEGSVFTAGAVIQWLRDNLGILRASGEIDALASSVPDSGGVMLVPAFAGLGAPHWDARARGTILGLTRGTTKAHIARAALEGIAFQVADLVDALESPLTELRVDGGASRSDLLMQFQADLLGVPLSRAANVETTALGAARLAGLATGVWKSADAIARDVAFDRRFEPRMKRDEALARRARWRGALERAKDWDREARP